MGPAIGVKQDGAINSSPRPLSSSGKKIQRSPSRQALLPTKKQLLWSKGEAFVWLLASALILWLGDGSTTTPEIVLYDERVKRLWFYAGLGFLGVDLVTFLYLSIWIKRVHHKSKAAAKAAPTVITTETLATTAAGLLFTVAYWPIWKFYTPAILVILFMGFTMLSQLRPSSWAYRSTATKP